MIVLNLGVVLGCDEIGPVATPQVLPIDLAFVVRRFSGAIGAKPDLSIVKPFPLSVSEFHLEAQVELRAEGSLITVVAPSGSDRCLGQGSISALKDEGANGTWAGLDEASVVCGGASSQNCKACDASHLVYRAD